MLLCKIEKQNKSSLSFFIVAKNCLKQVKGSDEILQKWVASSLPCSASALWTLLC